MAVWTNSTSTKKEQKLHVIYLLFHTLIIMAQNESRATGNAPPFSSIVKRKIEWNWSKTSSVVFI